MIELLIDERKINISATDLAIKAGSGLLRYALPLSAGFMVSLNNFSPEEKTLILSTGFAAALGEGVQHKYFQFVNTYGHPASHPEYDSEEKIKEEYQELATDVMGGAINGGITSLIMFGIGYNIAKLVQ